LGFVIWGDVDDLEFLVGRGGIGRQESKIIRIRIELLLEADLFDVLCFEYPLLCCKLAASCCKFV
jgi:hypothetical protein